MRNLSEITRITFLYLLLLLTFTSTRIRAQEVPPINTFNTEDYQAENQNWDISQSDNKFIYVANNAGLLEFNGESWELYRTPNETIMRSVKWFQNRIYTGFYMDFGYWVKNDFGIFEYTSLTETYNIEMLEDEQIWEIVELDGFMIFKSLSRIFLFDLSTKNFNIIEGRNNLTKLSKVNNTIYYQDLNVGIFKIENGTPVLISNHPTITNNRIVEIFNKNGNLYFITQKNGIYFLENGLIIQWKLKEDFKLEDKTLYSAKKLSNGNIVLGTISNGIIKIKENGEFFYQISQNNGLSNNTILEIFEDVDENIWLGLDNGINIVNLRSPFRFYLNKNNFWGTIYTSIVFNGYLYLGTNQGLYVKPNNTAAKFELIEGTQGQVWNLQAINNELFCSHDTGTFIIKNKEANKIVNIEGTWGVLAINNNKLLQGSYDGLYILEKSNQSWKLKNKVSGFSNSSKFFIKQGNQIYVNHEYKGVFRLTINNNLTEITQVIQDTSVQKGIHSSLVQYRGDVLYSNREGVFRFVKDKNKFVRDSSLSKLIPNKQFLSARLILDEENNRLWSFTNNDIRFIAPGKLSNKPELNIIPVKGTIHRGTTGYENLLALSNNLYFIGTSNGYLLVDLESVKSPKEFQIYLTKVLINEKDEIPDYSNLLRNDNLENSQNNIQFKFSVPNYNRASTLLYQYKLEGFNSKWSDYSEDNSILFENLPSGDYTFKARAVLDNKISSNEAIFVFSIANPWYMSTAALIVYAILFGGLIYIWYYFSRKFYLKQRRRLLERSQRELELKELENEQKIIKLNNEKLRDDIKNKNRELATSTMSIIKKNEFLNTIKTELLDGGETKISKVVKIIDKNLNNTDDWKLFQEAFNNADKNFLKKIKSKHSNLTPNDLRLCAYLRLNLSSKEIAPLLNISPRSVEVKRYRLRKKMNLEHNDNLTDYILSL